MTDFARLSSYSMASDRRVCRTGARQPAVAAWHRHPPRNDRRRRDVPMREHRLHNARSHGLRPWPTAIGRHRDRADRRLLNATGCTMAEVECIADRYPGARGVRQLRSTLALVDGGAESPKETELRPAARTRRTTSARYSNQGRSPPARSASRSVLVEALAGLLAELAGLDHAQQQRRCRVQAAP